MGTFREGTVLGRPGEFRCHRAPVRALRDRLASNLRASNTFR